MDPWVRNVLKVSENVIAVDLVLLQSRQRLMDKHKWSQDDPTNRIPEAYQKGASSPVKPEDG
jgi:hypothetical protein